MDQAENRDSAHSKSSDFFSVSEQFYILVEVESHPFINIQILNFFIYIIEGTLNQNVYFVIIYLLNLLRAPQQVDNQHLFREEMRSPQICLRSTNNILSVYLKWSQIWPTALISRRNEITPNMPEIH